MDEPRSIQMEAQVTSVRSRVDKSVGLTVATQELSPDDTLVLLRLQGKHLLLALTPLGELCGPPIKVATDGNRKTHSQRLRAALYVLYSASRERSLIGGNVPFETFYAEHMERLIEHIKVKIDKIKL